MKTQTRSIIATVLVSAMLVSCATPNGQGGLSQNIPCQPGGAQFTESPMASFAKQAILNPLANIGGTLLATAAANYSQQYTGKLNTLLTKLVTPKKKKKKKTSDQEFVDPGFQQGQPIDPNTGLPVQVDPYTGLPIQTDPNTGLPIQFDPNTGLPIGDQQGFHPGQFPGDSSTGFGESQPFDGGVPQDGFDPNYPNDVQSRGVPGQLPHATFPSTPCDQQINPQAYQTSYPQNQPYGYDPHNVAQPGQPYTNDQNAQGQGYDPYGQQAYPSDPNAQGYPSDPYAQQGYPQDPNASGYPEQDPYAQHTYPQDPNTQIGTETGIQTQETGTPIGLDVVMVKKTIRNGAPVVLPIQDGDLLRDGRGNAAAGDKFRIMFRPNSDGHVYVIAIDGSGWAQGIFPPPTSPLANPVKAGEQYVLPEGNNWFSLDQFKGIETIFFVVSQDKRQDIEEILQSITGHERPASESPQQVTKVAMVPYGVGGTRPSAKPFGLSEGSGQDHTIIPTSYLAQKAGQDLRLTRWFRHE
ncbi:MAG: DUF4384 domain-containing protein [Nitrospirota bacterium]|nr:DUF4384 domain-containing protein [Nitrospirota bacterium]